MHNRFKKLIKALLESDNSTARVEAEKAQQSIDSERQPLLERIALLDEQQAWLESTLKLHLPDESTATTSKLSTYKPATDKGEDGLTKKQRGQLIRDTAMQFVRQGKTEVYINEVLSDIEKNKGIKFSIMRPQAAVAATLLATKLFERTETGMFRYIGEATPPDALPLMESAEAH